MKAFYADHFVLPLPEGHRFPMEKYRLLRERVLEEGILAPATGWSSGAVEGWGCLMAGGYNVDVAETVAVHLQKVGEAKRYSEAWAVLTAR